MANAQSLSKCNDRTTKDKLYEIVKNAKEVKQYDNLIVSGNETLEDLLFLKQVLPQSDYYIRVANIETIATNQIKKTYVFK
ncbi:hypothetical protein CQA53_07975 [Helicobacter didelphidarum]|uniref:Uncharacterized protein n=1 Tax=Helicobacter didelphidarum TaxID=2040648 RepID=A0A3D8IG20_9HELI|nr:hypothetical protein [Helicobacter didelphidarum]RDU64068.1 hypothetical protein CQA53_07975 [Helicobacter didelphidarum]